MTASALRLEPYEASKHYQLVFNWWQSRGDDCLPVDVLPPTGAVVTRDTAVIAVCPIWLTNAAMAYLAFPMVAPGLPTRVAYDAIAMAITGAVDIARLKGCRCVWAAAENRGVDRMLTRDLSFTRVTPLHNYFLMLDPTVPHDILVGNDFSEQKG